MPLDILQDLNVETDSLSILADYLRLTARVFDLRCVGRMSGRAEWQYPSETIWQELIQTPGNADTDQEFFMPICQLSWQRSGRSADEGRDIEFEDPEGVVAEVLRLLSAADRDRFRAQCPNPFATAEGSTTVGYRFCSGWCTGWVVSLCWIYYAK